MAITIRSITDEQVEMAKSLTGKGTASAALVACVDLSASQSEMIANLRLQVKALDEKCRHSDNVMSRLASAADEALCIVRQRDLLS